MNIKSKQDLKKFTYICLSMCLFSSQYLNASGEGMIMNLSEDNNFYSGLHRRGKLSSYVDENKKRNPSRQERAQELYTKGMKHIKERNSYEKAFEYLSEVTELDPNNEKAWYNLGVLCEFGLGTEQDLKKAAGFYARVANQYDQAEKAHARVIEKLR